MFILLNLYIIFKNSKNMNLRVLLQDREKSDYNDIVFAILKKKLHNKIYDENKIQKWCESINYEILKFLNKKFENFKFICTTFIFDKKKKNKMQFNSYCFWVKRTDMGSGIKFENSSLCCFINIFKIEKKKEEVVNYDYENLGNI